MRPEFIVEQYEKYADDTWHLRDTERIGEAGVNLSLKNGKFYYDGRETQLNFDPNHPTCGAYWKVKDIVRPEDPLITSKIICEFTAYYLRPITYVIGVLVYRNSMPKYFCHPKKEPTSWYGYNVGEVGYDKDIMKLRKWLVKKFKGNMYFDEKNWKIYQDFV